LAKQLIKQFGFPIHYAPGEAEAECALLQREGIVDAVLSEDVDTLMFGSGVIIRNWSPQGNTGKTPTHVNLYDAVKIKGGDSGLDREGMILVALMSGGDYVPEGIPGCGPKTACEAARAGFGRDLCKLRKTDRLAIQEWRERLEHELKTNENKYFKRKHGALKIPDDFPRTDILGYYTHPVISASSGLDTLRRSIKWDQDLDFAGLRGFTHDAFEWLRLEGAKHFIRSLAPSLLVRGLRLRGDGRRLISDNIDAIREDEALLVKGLHGKRQHAVTDHTTELRVSYTPIELVKIDLAVEDPDLDLAVASTEADKSDEADLDAAELEDEEEETDPKKRGPTKFDPSKPARAWVLESFVKVGVPLTTEDWEAGLRRPKKAAAAKETTKAVGKGKGARRAKTTGDTTQGSIESFAKVTKPGTRPRQMLAKPKASSVQPHSASSPPARVVSKTVVDLSSSSPAKCTDKAPARQAKEPSLSPVLEDLPPSVTKRRRRAPMQRSHTLPANLSSSLDRPATPPPRPAIDMLDLISSPAGPSPSPLPAKKVKMVSKSNAPAAGSRHANSVTSPAKNKQTTLDAWSRSPAVTPTKPRETTRQPPAPVPAPPAFTSTKRDAIETLDLTCSSPAPATTMQPSQAHPRRSSASKASPRPPLQSISSNASFSSTSSNPKTTTTSRPASKPTSSRTRRTSPRLNKTASIHVEELDLTGIDSSPPPPAPRNPMAFAAPPRPAQLASPPPTQALPAAQALRRSPRHSASTSTSTSSSTSSVSTLTSTSPPAPWKTRAKKKREVVLRKSVAGAWDFVDASSSPVAGSGSGSGSGVVLKGKERRKWRESEIEIVDMVSDG
jgi:Holliday junction resolvase YEN1